MLFDVYKNKRVLITGHTGFKGSWLSLWLHRLGADVSGIALDPPTEPGLFHEAGVAELVEDYRCDIRDMEFLLATMEEPAPEAIFHLAAQPIVRNSYDLARETFDINTMGSIHVFECARQVSSVKALVHVSTDKCYENTHKAEGYTEADPMGGHDPYSASKGAAEIAFSSYNRSFFISEGRVMAASGRAGNVIGGGDWADCRIIPDAVRAWSEGTSLTVRNPQAIRPWQHVLEALSGYLTLGAHLLQRDAVAVGGWNFGPPADNVMTVEDLIQVLGRGWAAHEWKAVETADNKKEADLLTLNCEKARRDLDWSPVWGFEETVERVSNWYRGYYANESARDLCLADIAAYEQAIKARS